MLRSWLFFPVLALVLLTPGVMRAGEGPIALKRGVAVQAELSDQGLALTSSDFEDLRSRGFDFVRLDAVVDPRLIGDAGLDDATLAEFESGVRALIDMRLRVIVGLFPSEGPVHGSARQTVAGLAQMLARVGSDRAALSLSSQVQGRTCNRQDAPNWAAALPGLIGAARDAAPDLSLIVSGHCDDITGLVRIDPAALKDARVMFSFAFFEPEKFTRQGIGDARDVKGVPWPADDVAVDLAMIYTKLLLSAHDLSPEEREVRLAHVRRHISIYLVGEWSERHIQKAFAKVTSWAESHDIPNDRLLLGAFGVASASDERGGALTADRFRWLNAVRRMAEARGLAWTLQSEPGAGVDPVAMEAIGISQAAVLPATGSLPVRR